MVASVGKDCVLHARTCRDHRQPRAQPVEIEAVPIARSGGHGFDAKRGWIARSVPDYPGRETVPVRFFCESEAPNPRYRSGVRQLRSKLERARQDNLDPFAAIPTSGRHDRHSSGMRKMQHRSSMTGQVRSSDQLAGRDFRTHIDRN